MNEQQHFHALFPLVKANDIAGVQAYLESINFSYVPGKRIVNQAVKQGNKEMLEYLRLQGARLELNLLNTAIDFGHLECLSYLLQTLNNRVILYDFVHRAVAAGKLHIIEYLRVNHGCTFDPNSIHFAAEKGQLDIVKYLFDLSLTAEHSNLFFHPSIADIAASNGHLQVLLFVLEKLKQLDLFDDLRHNPAVELIENSHHDEAMKVLEMYPEFRTNQIVARLLSAFPPLRRQQKDADVEPKKLYYIRQAVEQLGCLFDSNAVCMALANDSSLLFEYLYNHPSMEQQKQNGTIISDYNLRNCSRCHGMKCIKILFSQGFFNTRKQFLATIFTKDFFNRIVDFDDPVWRKLMDFDFDQMIADIYPEPWHTIQRVVCSKRRQLAIQEHCSYLCLTQHLPRDVIMYCVNSYL